ncbi:MAG: D-alanyl-D-alanine carboxypeptidase [Clostridiales bacterium]|nr:D-alanyl-D-alanine carboxypeptidase [Clostridiales bacterium]
MKAIGKIVLTLVIAAILSGYTAAQEALPEEVFDEKEWEAVEALAAVEDIALKVPSAILMEKETGTVIYELNAHERMTPASVTKIMTMLLTAEAIESGRISVDDAVIASAFVETFASSMGGSQIYLKEGEQMTVEELLKSVAVASANDASVALAEHIAGSEDAFVNMMNARAAQLGMEDTHFANCTGLPSKEEHLTSAWDIAIMSRELLKHEFIKKYTTIWMDSVRNGEFGLSNTNKLVRFYKGTTGLKTGFTQEAMYCLSASAQRDGIEFIAVIMHAETSDIRFEAAKLLLNYGFANYTLVPAAPEGVLSPIAVELGIRDWVQPVLAGNEKLLVEKSVASGVVKTVDIPDSLEAPVEAGQKIGTLYVRDKSGALLAETAIIAGDDVGRLSLWQIFVKYLKLLCAGVF